MDFIDPMVITILVLVLVLTLVAFAYIVIIFSERYERSFKSNIVGINEVDEFLNDEESLRHLANEYDLSHLSPEEQWSFNKGQDFTVLNPPNINNTRDQSSSETEDFIIRERGIDAFEFEQEEDILNPRFLVIDKTDVHFCGNDSPYSVGTAVMNISLPVRHRTSPDIIYFEVKIYECLNENENPNAHFAIGLVTKPYPSSFRLPGYNTFSVAYESTGNLKINKPLPTPLQQHLGINSKYNAQVLPPLQQADVVGFGYTISSGTLFITHNGRKMMDILRGCYMDLYPAVGCFLTNLKFQVNIGQRGYVWTEANVRKYGFISSNDMSKITGNRGLTSLPNYGSLGKVEGDKLLEKGEELPPSYPEDEIDFFGRSTNNTIRVGSTSMANDYNSQRSSREK